MTDACNFISLGENMRALLDKNGRWNKKRKEEKKITITKKGAKFARCVAVVFGEAEWKRAKLVQSFNRLTRCEWRSTIFRKFLW